MNISEITTSLNTLGLASPILRGFPTRMARLHGKSKTRSHKLFSKSTIKDEYAFHDGGRSDLQLNIGVEWLDGMEILRYGVGMSFYPNQSQPDPMHFLPPKIHALNEYIRKNPAIFADLWMWHYDNPGMPDRSPNYPVREVPMEWITFENFIFIGSFLPKPLSEVNSGDLPQIISLLERLSAATEYVEEHHSRFRATHDGNRISRLCWNDNGWIMPSGRLGKSTDTSSHEGQYGFGHEEWLGDTSKIIDGFHYAFLESVRGLEDSASGKIFNIELFTVDGRTSNRFAVGSIQNAEIIGREIADKVMEEYAVRGWLGLMDRQIAAVEATKSDFSGKEGFKLFNIRFQPQDLRMFESYRLIEDPWIAKAHRYELMYKRADIRLAVPIGGKIEFTPDSEREPDQENQVEWTIYERPSRPIENMYLHKKIQACLKNYLIDQHGLCIAKECKTGQGTLIDIVREYKNAKIFYEIKVYSSIKACIREALGQLLEYSNWPDTNHAKVLIIVGLASLCNDSRNYLRSLRTRYSLPIYYQQFDLQSKQVVNGDYSDAEIEQL